MLLHPKLIVVAAILLIAALAAPAMAGTLYKWTAEDGSVAFTDDPKRVPERYRSQVETRTASGLDDYERFTPGDPVRQGEYQKRLEARLERLRRFNAPGTVGMPLAPAVQPSIMIQTDERTALTIPNGAQGEAPIIVEEMRVRDPHSIATRHVTVVRQGDRVLSVIKPSNPAQSATPPWEADFESR
jgi:hypothetical protein